MSTLIGRLHPLFVHLPIGMLLCAAALEWRAVRNPALRPVLPAVWLLTALSAIGSAATGWTLGGEGGFDLALLPWHQNLGIAVAVLSTLLWALRQFQPQREATARWVTLMAVGLLTATTWLGATMTHGANFLWGGETAKAASLGASAELPEKAAAPATAEALRPLQERGVIFVPVAANSHYLSANFVNARAFTDADAGLLAAVSDQLVWLKLGGSSISDSALLAVGRLPNLTRLSLEHTRITDAGLAHLTNLSRLQMLNLTGTNITGQGLATLKSLPALRRIFLFQTNVADAEWPALRTAFPNVQIDTGGYALPFLETDTARLKAPGRYQ